MNKASAIRSVIEASVDHPVVFTTGYASRIAAQIDKPNHFYMVGSMGLAASIGSGIAFQTGCPVLIVNGDGAVLMNPVDIMSVAILPGLRLIHIVLDDSVYASTGGQKVPSSGVDLSSLARACGYSRAFMVEDEDALSDLIFAELQVDAGPVFIHCKITADDLEVPRRIDSDLLAHARRFKKSLVNGPFDGN